uniref:Uncharacterized protein n=1 Tax=Anopheles culicifacies TaxID=139723 RepID=A0A182LS80_9DIPT
MMNISTPGSRGSRCSFGQNPLESQNDVDDDDGGLALFSGQEGFSVSDRMIGHFPPRFDPIVFDPLAYCCPRSHDDSQGFWWPNISGTGPLLFPGTELDDYDGFALQTKVSRNGEWQKASDMVPVFHIRRSFRMCARPLFCLFAALDTVELVAIVATILGHFMKTAMARNDVLCMGMWAYTPSILDVATWEGYVSNVYGVFEPLAEPSAYSNWSNRQTRIRGSTSHPC